uniref:SXP/RAL-2 family protein Ani s 5-like cation-binding domain-containing protein n=1 Tax=Parascaris univalens TaxID=6257 RepID=A0A915BWD9_PARUN
ALRLKVHKKAPFISGQGFNHRRIPPFANGTSDEAKQQLLEIFKNRFLTKGEIDEKVQEWVNSQNNSVQIAYEQFETGKRQQLEQIKSQAENSTLSEQAKSALKQIADLFGNTTITIEDERRAKKNISRGLSRDERKEVREVLRKNRPTRE